MAADEASLEEIVPLSEVPTENIEDPYTPSFRFNGESTFDQFERLDDPSNSAMQQSGGVHSGRDGITTGIAFSGGGIRSAAFCSGALRRMLRKKVSMDVYLSCVSGGGYTGAAFLDWQWSLLDRSGKCDQREQLDSGERRDSDDHRTSDEDPESGLLKNRGFDKKGPNTFFDRMRENAGYVCNWQKPCKAIVQSAVFVIVLIFTVGILPCLLWLPYSLPVAVAVDVLFGAILREGITCSRPVKSGLNRSSYLLMEMYDACSPYGWRVLLFVLTPVASLIFYFVSRSRWSRCCQRFRGPFRLLSILCWLMFAFTFFPWFAHDFLWPMKVWVKVIAFVILLVVPFFFPIIRKYAAVYLAFYAYTYVISWKVFKTELFGTVPYSDSVFYAVFTVCALLFLVFPILGSIHQTCFNVYYRYNLSKAFFEPPRGTKLHWEDVFPWCVLLDPFARHPSPKKIPNSRDDTKELTLGALADTQGRFPTFISNITVNYWKIVENFNKDDDYHHLLAFSPTEVKVIGRYLNENGEAVETDGLFDDRFCPHDMRLSSAMAISGAALSFDMGHYENKLDMVLDLLALLGIGMGDEKVCNQKEEAEKGFLNRCFIPAMVEFILCLPLAASPFAYYLGHSTDWVAGLVLVHIVIVLALSSIAVLHTGYERDNRWLRFFITRTFFVRFLRGFLNIPNVGTDPPLVLRLSDGGHFENLALLPLLEKKLKKIVIVDGSCNPGGDKYADELVRALKIATKKLPVWFEGETSKNIEEDIRINFLTKDGNGKLKRHYKFKVLYCDADTEKGEPSEGEIMFLAPRHPRESIRLTPDPVIEQPKGGSQQTAEGWKKFGHLLNKEDWGDGPELTKDEANELNWCCCSCCHCNKCDCCCSCSSNCQCCHRCECECCSDGCCHRMSSLCLGEFPHHITANQFFTPEMFRAYHREGYAACVEAKIHDFFTG